MSMSLAGMIGSFMSGFIFAFTINTDPVTGLVNGVAFVLCFSAVILSTFFSKREALVDDNYSNDAYGTFVCSMIDRKDDDNDE